MEAILQTNKTLLIESINPERLNLLTLVGDIKNIDSLSDDKIKEILSYLEVSSFTEFMDKFRPVVYAFFDANNQRVAYTLERPNGIPDHMLTEIPLNEHSDFIKMLFTLVEAKKAQGIMNVDFKFEKLLALISPEKVMDDIKQVRADLRYNYGEYTKLEDGDPKKLDVADKLNVLIGDARENYANPLAMLPLAIEDIKTRLLLGAGDTKKGGQAFSAGMLTLQDDGELKVIEAPKESPAALITVDSEINEGLIAVIGDDFDNVNDSPSEYLRSLAIRTLCPLSQTSSTMTKLEVTQEVQNYNNYLGFYKNAKDDFIKVAKPLAEKLLGVRMFFDQYPKKVKGDMRPTLLVANCTPEMMAKSSNITRLIAYLNTVNAKNDYSNTIWYAIVPSISLTTKTKNIAGGPFQGNKQVDNPHVNNIESLVSLMDALKDYRVQCFFSFEGSEHTTFNHLAVKGIDDFASRCTPLADKLFSEFAIPCLPNFTVVPKDKSGLVLDKMMTITEEGGAELSNEKQDIMRLWIEGVYIGAAYVAAGLVAAYQCPTFLKSVFKRKAHDSSPGVRFDIEQGENALRVRTTMAKEITGFTNGIKDIINRRGFGFVFSSENANYGDETISHIMVYKARCLMLADGTYEPIYKTQMTTYVERLLRHATSDFKSDNIRDFFSTNPSSHKSRWEKTKDYVNGVLQLGDDINFSIDEASGICTLDATFNGDTKNLEIEINRHKAGA